MPSWINCVRFLLKESEALWARINVKQLQNSSLFTKHVLFKNKSYKQLKIIWSWMHLVYVWKINRLALPLPNDYKNSNSWANAITGLVWSLERTITTNLHFLLLHFSLCVSLLQKMYIIDFQIAFICKAPPVKARFMADAIDTWPEMKPLIQ